MDVFPGEPGGPLAQFITEDIFVSAVGTGDVSLLEGQAVGAGTAAGAAAMAGAGGAAGAAGQWTVTEEEAEGRAHRRSPRAPSRGGAALAGAEGVLRQVRHGRRLHHQHSSSPPPASRST